MPSEAFRRHRAYRENKLQPLVSVLICAYNVEKYFAQSLAAVVNQTWRNLDILIVDDGSTDGTLAIAQRFQEQDGRIRILAQPRNSGLIPSLNIGLDELAKSGMGEYIARTDADDIAAPDWIEKIVGEMEKDRSIIAMGAWLEVLSEEKDGNRLARHHEHGKIWKKPTQHEDIAAVFPFGNPIHNNTMIMRRSVIDGGLRYNTERDWAEDYQFWYDVSKLGRLAYYPEALVKYRLHANQVSSKYSVRQHEIAQGIQKTARNDFLQSMGFKTRFDSLEYRQIKAVAYELLEKHLPEEDFERARRFLYQCFKRTDTPPAGAWLDFAADGRIRRLFTLRQYFGILRRLLKNR
ncbi:MULTISPECIES: glycosyltransferase family 2 protein [Neisseria]|uniref:glycosyltransferase family 2 protein n=1 Tax=Neisseria TaxID=482 RepID=UPI000E586D76|nr:MULTISPECIES: glycosyltransferase family 2 protein [Neisseria]MBG9132783.1 glycosyltransferase [Neisseria meningitidis]MCI3177639.1 glycosyltransferase family 2 protein [Neisseria meningitidis]TNL17077.1 glycosyltransferase family 2 protein [Neisseria meningitidis]TNL20595.1 glycosyltransferase family 2 protein [Neisseria meningitidis]TNL24286.1 glycosyltransferase family 2 protein [Neisseria meningitidis]